MWKSVGSPHRAWVFVTSTGIPLAAQTLLKFTPPAITMTSASSGPSSGTSITSSWIACSGSPKRSGRTSCACIFAGTSPIGGSSPISYRSLPMRYHPSSVGGRENPSKGEPDPLPVGPVDRRRLGQPAATVGAAVDPSAPEAAGPVNPPRPTPAAALARAERRVHVLHG